MKVICYIILLSNLFSQDWAAKIYSEYSSSVVILFRIENGEWVGSGTGFYCDNEGSIITNKHVVEGSNEMWIMDPDFKGDFSRTTVNDYYKATIEYIDSDYDFALLRTDIKGKPVIIGNSRDLIPGNEIVTLSNPQGFNYSLSTGIVSALRDWDKDHPIGYGEYIQITATIAHGSSGGPLFNKKGEVIGVTSGGAGGLGQATGAELNWALAIDQLKPAFESRTAYKPMLSSNSNSQRSKPKNKAKNKKNKKISKSKQSVNLTNSKNNPPQVRTHYNGEDIFKNYCSSCHSLGTSRNTLMNLGDGIWINSSDYNDIVNIITNGKPQKGKIPYKGVLSPDQIRMISNYIMYVGESEK